MFTRERQSYDSESGRRETSLSATTGLWRSSASGSSSRLPEVRHSQPFAPRQSFAMASFASLFGKRVPKDQTEEILGRHLTQDFKVFPMAKEASSSDQVMAVAERLGVTFPQELVAHLCGRFPGIYVEAKEDVWRRPKPYDVGPFWTFLYAFHTYTVSADGEDWMRIDVAGRKFQADTGLPAVPVLKVVGDANCYCVSGSGDLVQFDHELGKLEPVDATFFQVFEREILALTKRTLDKKSQSDRDH